MKICCKRCNSEYFFTLPIFSNKDKKEFTTLKNDSSIKLVQTLIHSFKLTHKKAKFITLHINKTYGKCHRCDFDSLDKEYVNCPKCNALNFNWFFK